MYTYLGKEFKRIMRFSNLQAKKTLQRKGKKPSIEKLPFAAK